MVLLVLLLAVYVDGRTPVGYEIRVAGANRGFAAYGGLSVPRLTLGTLAAAGAVAGLAGAIIVMSQPFRFIDDALTAPGYTFAGVAAALLAGGRPALLPLTSVLFTILTVGSAGMERDVDVPRQLGQVLQAVVILVLALPGAGLPVDRPAGAGRRRREGLSVDIFSLAFVAAVLASSAPVLYAALGGALCGLAGLFNIALEGQLLWGAFSAVTVSWWTGSAWAGVPPRS